MPKPQVLVLPRGGGRIASGGGRENALLPKPRKTAVRRAEKGQHGHHRDSCVASREVHKRLCEFVTVTSLPKHDLIPVSGFGYPGEKCV